MKVGTDDDENHDHDQRFHNFLLDYLITFILHLQS